MEISYCITSMETEKNGETSVSNVNWRMALDDVTKSTTAHWWLVRQSLVRYYVKLSASNYRPLEANE